MGILSSMDLNDLKIMNPDSLFSFGSETMNTLNSGPIPLFGYVCILITSAALAYVTALDQGNSAGSQGINYQGISAGSQGINYQGISAGSQGNNYQGISAGSQGNSAGSQGNSANIEKKEDEKKEDENKEEEEGEDEEDKDEDEKKGFFGGSKNKKKNKNKNNKKNKTRRKHK
jgi:hypothetical protein